MPVNGTYKYEKGENIEGFLVAIGVKEDKAKELASITDRTVTLNYTGDKLEVETKGKETIKNTLTIGSPSTFVFGTGFEIETFNVDGNTAKRIYKKV
ncbi:hypothetical protein Anas_10633 [Armadillidium nasatum]|uniref:Fatty acid-binding protein, liver n=1 Tax=Armadillidium nasatum TaxID=96803 RepID=A0A5N5T6J3_9CRUS|nr:hypothetical protein Anas_10633 [Armadillidium nasatum]